MFFLFYFLSYLSGMRKILLLLSLFITTAGFAQQTAPAQDTTLFPNGNPVIPQFRQASVNGFKSTQGAINGTYRFFPDNKFIRAVYFPYTGATADILSTYGATFAGLAAVNPLNTGVGAGVFWKSKQSNIANDWAAASLLSSRQFRFSKAQTNGGAADTAIYHIDYNTKLFTFDLMPEIPGYAKRAGGNNYTGDQNIYDASLVLRSTISPNVSTGLFSDGGFSGRKGTETIGINPANQVLSWSSDATASVLNITKPVDFSTTTGAFNQAFQMKAGTIALISDITGAVGDTSRLALKTGNSSITNLNYKTNGTAGNGYFEVGTQSVSPTPATNKIRIYADSLNRLSWKNSLYRRTIRVTRNADMTIQVPYRLNPILADSTDIAAAYAPISGSPNYITTNTNQTGLTGDKTTSGVWTFSSSNTAASLVVNSTAASPNGLQTWQSNGTNIGYFNAQGVLGATGISAFNGTTRAYVNTTDNGTSISRNNSGGNVLDVSDLSATASGLLQSWSKQSIVKGVVDYRGYLGIATGSPTHGITLGSTASNISLYGTVNQTTDYQRLLINAAAGSYGFSVQNAGTSTGGNFQINTASVMFNMFGLSGSRNSTGISSYTEWYRDTGGNSTTTNVNSVNTASGGTSYISTWLPTINQSGTASSITKATLPYYQGVGSGAQIIERWGTAAGQNGSGTITPLVDIMRTGVINFNGATSTGNQIYGANAAGTASEAKTITAGAGISVTNTAGAITISANSGGINRLQKSAAYTVLISDFDPSGRLFLSVDATAGNVAITLPSVATFAPTAKTYELVVTKTDASANAVTLSGSANINGSSTYNVTQQFGNVTITSNATIYQAR